MTTTPQPATSTSRPLARRLARPLTETEITSVGGALRGSGTFDITNCEISIDVDCGDCEPD